MNLIMVEGGKEEGKGKEMLAVRSLGLREVILAEGSARLYRVCALLGDLGGSVK